MIIKIFKGGELNAASDCKSGALYAKRQNSSFEQHWSVIENYAMLLDVAARIFAIPGVFFHLPLSSQCAAIPHTSNIHTSCLEKADEE